MTDKSTAVEGEVIEAPKVDEGLRLIQSRDHPHYGEAGWLVPDTLQSHTGQYYFKLSNCQHGTAGCYVLESDITQANADLSTQENSTNQTGYDPYKYNQIVVEKLAEALGKSYSIIEACDFAGINKNTYYEWMKNIPEFEELMTLAKLKTTKAAKNVVSDAVAQGDVATAKWWLERRDPEFKPKAEVDNNIGIQETRNKIAEFLDDDDIPDAISEQSTAADAPVTTDEVAQPPTDIS